MTPRSEPRTEAGRAHRRYIHAIVLGPNPDGSFDCRDGCECAADILAIEAEAALTSVEVEIEGDGSGTALPPATEGLDVDCHCLCHQSGTVCRHCVPDLFVSSPEGQK